jgi:ketosteroid isomerase-like protein
MSEEAVDVVRRAIDAYNRRDFEAIRALNHPDVEVDWSASRGLVAGIYRGADEVIAFMRDFLETFEYVRMDADRYVESGELVVVPNTTHIRGRDGIETVARSALFFELRDGRVARIRLYQETTEALEAAGLAE